MATTKFTDDLCSKLWGCASEIESDVGTLKSIDYVIDSLIERVEPMPGQDELMGALVSMSTLMHQQLVATDKNVVALYDAIRATRAAGAAQ